MFVAKSEGLIKTLADKFGIADPENILCLTVKVAADEVVTLFVKYRASAKEVEALTELLDPDAFEVVEIGK